MKRPEAYGMHPPCSTYRACLFDLDGTLIDSTEAIVLSTTRALAELGWPALDRAVIVGHIGYKLETVFPERGVEERRRLIDVIGRHYDALCEAGTALCPGMGEVVEALGRRGVPMGVVTSKRRHHAEAVLAALGVRERFRVVVACEDVIRMKPDPEGLVRALEALALAPAECLYVGDTRVDVAAARAAGMSVAGVAWGTDGLEVLAAAGIDHAIDRPEALPPLFGGPESPAGP
jgi:2-phosphoglycolate phosphatase